MKKQDKKLKQVPCSLFVQNPITLKPLQQVLKKQEAGSSSKKSSALISNKKKDDKNTTKEKKGKAKKEVAKKVDPKGKGAKKQSSEVVELTDVDARQLLA